jgi:hypothetical protein
MHKSATKCNETLCKWCKNKHGASKIIDTFETYQYGAPGDSQDDYICMAKSTAMECMSRFCRAIVSVFGSDYVITPNKEDTACILSQNAERRFPGMLGRIDCSVVLQVKGGCSVVLEDVADQDL